MNTSEMITTGPDHSEAADYYFTYIDLVPKGDIRDILRAQLPEIVDQLNGISEEKSLYRYAPGKWSIRELAGHLIDAERVFGYRSFCIARGESRNLPGFDEKEYMLRAPYNQIDLEDLLSELRLARLSNIAMLRNLDDEAWMRIGTANDAQVSVRALAFIMAGHVRHHLGVLRERYGLG